MLRQLAGLLCIIALFSCQQPKKSSPSHVIDCYLTYRVSPLTQSINGNLAFWKKRMDSLPDLYVNGPKYASALVLHFRLHGDMNDLLKADSLYRLISKANKDKEPELLRILAELAMLQHHFPEADSFLQKAIVIEGNTFPNTFLNFDIAFESGRYDKAKKLLTILQSGNEYGYLFRKSKYEHYDGSLDTSIACMQRAAEKAGNNIYLKQTALSNAADLCIHKGDLEKARELYRECLDTDPADLHSITGLGWIALTHDKDNLAAQSAFEYVHSHSQSPDILLKFSQLEEARSNKTRQKEYASEFASMVRDPRYERMYSKYLIDLYTGILNDPAKAVDLSLQEISNRPTPQVFAWYAWSLFCNNEKDKASEIYKGYVSGKPLEGTELYYMGKMMQGSGKEYMAKQFFKAAWKNRYDLSPARQKELNGEL